jgi:FKBP-type peptidyl-prolyl cis-trans isomerase FkpA
MKRNKCGLLMILPVIGLILILYSCDPSKSYVKHENSLIQNYLSKNPDLAFEQKASGLYYLDVVVGTGVAPVKNDSAYVMYTGSLLDGTIFGSNVETKDTFKFKVGEGKAIQGIDEGVTYMKQGGKATLLVPSKLAYGPTGLYQIAGYTPLLFDVALVKVKKAAK